MPSAYALQPSRAQVGARTGGARFPTPTPTPHSRNIVLYALAIALWLLQVQGSLFSGGLRFDLSQASAQSAIQYIYDEAGRLIGTVAPNGDAAQYNYDAAGNITSITRTASTSVSVLEFSPNSGPIGTTVTIWGTGFSTTPSQNTVQFNGTGATVTSSTANQLVVSVPSGATTGTIAVSSPNGSATSAQSFTVTASSGAPTISSFSPTIGLVGDAVTVTGTNFQSVAASNVLQFNLALAAVASASATQLGTNVPALATSGPMTVTTAYGTATSTGDFFVVPAGKTVSDIAFTGRIAIDGADMVATLSSSTQVALVVFTATKGQTLRLILSPVTIASATVSTYSPTGAQLTFQTVTTAGETVLLNSLPMSGTYTIRIVPQGSATGSATLSLKSAVPLAGDGSGVAVNLPRSGENGVFTFTASAGQWFGLALSNLSFTPSTGGPSLVMALYNSKGQTIATPSPLVCTSAVFAPGVRCGIRNLPADVYTLVVNPNGTVTATMTLTLSSDVTASLTPNGSAHTFSTSIVGQQAHYPLVVTDVSQRFSILASGKTFPGTVSVYVLKPDGTQWTSMAVTSSSGNFLDLVNFPVTGTYNLYVAPTGFDTGAITTAVKQDDANTLDVDGSSLAINLASAQNGFYTFTIGSAQWLGLGVSSVTFTPPTGATLTVTPYNSSGQIVSTPSPLGCTGSWSAPGKRCAMRNLAAGTYNLAVNPQGLVAASMTLTLSSDISGSLTPNGATETFSTSRIGQQGHYGFSVTSGQSYKVVWSGSTLPTGSVIYVLKPDLTQQSSVAINDSGLASGTLNLGTLTTGGTYYVYIAPAATSTGQVTVKVTNP